MKRTILLTALVVIGCTVFTSTFARDDINCSTDSLSATGLAGHLSSIQIATCHNLNTHAAACCLAPASTLGSFSLPSKKNITFTLQRPASAAQDRMLAQSAIGDAIESNECPQGYEVINGTPAGATADIGIPGNNSPLAHADAFDVTVQFMNKDKEPISGKYVYHADLSGAACTGAAGPLQMFFISGKDGVFCVNSDCNLKWQNIV